MDLDTIYLEALQEEELAKNEGMAAKKPKKKKLTRAERMQLKLKNERDFKMLEMRDKLRREYNMSKKTARKYRERWEDMCREVKLKQMKQELEDWEKQVNRVMKQKDEKIELILDEIAKTEDFHNKGFSTNLEMMDYLMDILKTFQDACYRLYEREASDLLHNFYQEVEVRDMHDNHIALNCESVVHATEFLAEQELLTDYKIFLDKRDDRVSDQIEKRYRLRDKILKQMKCLREQLLEFLNSLKNTTLDANKYEKINLLMERQRNFQLESVKLNSTEERSNQIYADLQGALAQEEKDSKRKLHDLQAEYAYFMRMRKKIENEMKLNGEETYEKLKVITSGSYEIKKKYEKLEKYGELLLSLAASCRKFQTESEKVLPGGNFQESEAENFCASESFKLKSIELKDHVDISETELQNNAQLMCNFWRRQALAEAQVVLLEERKNNLLKENQNYIDTIKRLSKTDNAEDLKETLTVKPAKNYLNL